MDELPRTRHSAHVILELHADGQVIPVAQMSHEFLIIHESVKLPPMEAVLRVCIDGQESGGPLYLPEGIDPARSRTKVESVKAAQPASAAA